MTALERYAKLEAEARYFDGQSAEPRNVVVSFGERSLVIMGFDNVALAHWPLASLRALSRKGEKPAQIVPHPESDERLVIADPEMLDAIRRVCPGLYRRQVDRKGVRRAFLWAGGAAGALALMMFVLIPTLAGQLALLIPPQREQQLGDAVVEQLKTLLSYIGDGDRPVICETSEGLAALDRMTERLAPDPDVPYPLRVAVLDHPMVNAVAVPGGRVLLFRGLIEEASAPEEVAGVLAHELGHVIHRDPTRMALRTAGTAGILGLVLGDVFGASVVVVATDAMLNASYQREAEAKADEAAHEMLAEAELPSKPFAEFFRKMREKHGDMEGALKLISSHPGLAERAEAAAEADQIGDGPFEPVLTDQEWIALKGICEGGMPRVRRGGRME